MAPEHVRKWYPAAYHALKKTPSQRWDAVDWAEVARKGILLTPVRCASLTEILRTVGLQWVDLFVLDTEGAELDVLRSIDFDLIGFGVVVVEAYSPSGSRPKDFAQRVIDVMEQRAGGRYRLLHRKHGRNVWFVHQNFKPRAKPAHGIKFGQR